MSAIIEERVAAGAAWLDEHEPGWVDQIDVDQLDLGSGCQCILGQLTADTGADEPYLVGVYRRGIEADEAIQLGFNRDDLLYGYGLLTAAWRQLIQTRRAER